MSYMNVGIFKEYFEVGNYIKQYLTITGDRGTHG